MLQSFVGLLEGLFGLLAQRDVAQQPAQTDHALRNAHGGHGEIGWKSRAGPRLQADFPVLHAFELSQPRQEGVKGRGLFLSYKISQGLIKQMRLRHAQQGSGSTIGFLDNTVGVSDQVAVWGKVKQLLVALALDLCSQAGSRQSLVLLVLFLLCHMQLFERRLQIFQDLWQHLCRLSWLCRYPLVQSRNKLVQSRNPTVQKTLRHDHSTPP